MLLELLGTILQYLWDFIPRPVLVGSTQKAVRFLFGRWGTVIQPGLCVVWPLVEEWEVYHVNEMVTETSIMPVTDLTGNSWQIRLVIEYEIWDPREYHLQQHDGRLKSELLAGSAALTLLSTMTTDEIKYAGIANVCKAIEDRISSDLYDRGVLVTGVRAIMFDRCRSFFLSNAERLS